MLRSLTSIVTSVSLLREKSSYRRETLFYKNRYVRAGSCLRTIKPLIRYQLGNPALLKTENNNDKEDA